MLPQSISIKWPGWRSRSLKLELLEVLKIAKSKDGRIGEEGGQVIDEKRRVTIGYVDSNDQNLEMKIPIDGFEIDELTSSQS